MSTSPENLRPLLESAIAERVFPGAAHAVGDMTDIHFGATGSHTYDSMSPAVGMDTLYDLASLTKVLHTTPLAMLLHAQGKLQLDSPISKFLVEHMDVDPEGPKVRHLLRHDSGYPAYARLEDACPTPEEAEIRLLEILVKGPEAAVGAETTYSCLNAIFVSWAFRAITSGRAGALLREEVFEPLDIHPTFLPGAADMGSCAPTVAIEPWRRAVAKRNGRPYAATQKYLQGEVHDPLAYLQGGVSGNAGLFGTVADVAIYAQEVLRAWHGEGRVHSQETVRRFTAPDAPGKRPLGWDIKAPEGSSAGSLFGPRTFGHTGYTGTSVWIDPEAAVFAVLLTNRIHPDDRGAEAMLALRREFHDAAYRLLTQ